MPNRNVTNQAIRLITAMFARGMKNRDIQFYFNRQDRPMNLGPVGALRRIFANADELMALGDCLEVSFTIADDTRRRLIETPLAEPLTGTDDRELEAAE